MINRNLSILIFFYSIFVTQMLNAQESRRVSTGAVGDVKYSILNPEQFAMVNGDGWVLLDGKRLEPDTDLYKLLLATGHAEVIPDKKLPNADGVFLRGVDTNDADNYGDPQKNRKVGSYQNDLYKVHTHVYTFDDFGHRAGRGNGNDNVFDNDSHKNKNTAKSGGVETRPKNISLYIYIKVNNN